MSSFQGVGIEGFHCIQVSSFQEVEIGGSTVYRGVLISGCWNREELHRIERCVRVGMYPFPFKLTSCNPNYVFLSFTVALSTFWSRLSITISLNFVINLSETTQFRELTRAVCLVKLKDL